MNWRVLTDLVVWRFYGEDYDRIAAMRVIVKQAQRDPAIGRPQPRFATPKWSRFVLLTDARGRSLVAQAWNRMRRAA